MPMRRTICIASAAAALLAVPAAAEAHVTLQPSEAPAGGFTRLDVRVPTEREDASTTKVEVKFPAGFTSVSTEPVPGWTASVKKTADRVDTVTWTGDGKQGKIGPGEFQDFGLSVAVPDKPGASLTFKALQTYSNGEVVRWIGPPDAEEPAPRVALTAASAEGTGSEGGGDSEGAPTWLAVLALVVGALGLAAGVAGMTAARRRPA
jgi:uncharacterized protein YcnI